MQCINNGILCTNREYSGHNKYVPLLNVENVTICDGNDSVNYLLTDKACYIFHQLIGDDILYFLMNYSCIFVPVTSMNHQWWQLMGRPASDRMWEIRAEKRRKRKEYIMQQKENAKKERKSKYKLRTNTSTNNHVQANDDETKYIPKYKKNKKYQKKSKQGYLMLSDFNKRKHEKFNKIENQNKEHKQRNQEQKELEMDENKNETNEIEDEDIDMKADDGKIMIKNQ